MSNDTNISNTGGNLEYSVQGDFVGGDKVSGDKIVTIQNIYQAAEKARLIPRMAPAAPTLVGRSAQLFDLLVAVQERPTHAESAAVLVLAGMGGVGKSALAAAVANDPPLQEEFPDGTLWAELGPAPDVMTAFAVWGDQLGVDLADYATVEARQRALRSAVYDKKLLMVVDDVWEAAEAHAFLIASPASCIIFTTRRANLGAELSGRAAQQILISPLAEPDALALLQVYIPQAVQADRRGALALVNRMGGLPLGIALAGQMMAREWQAGLGFAGALAELNEREARLGLANDGQQGMASLRLMLSVSYDHLPTDEARLVFRQLGVFGSKPRSFEMAAAAYVWGMESRPAQKLMVSLVNQQMVEALGEGRFTLHSTLADFALSLLESNNELPPLRRRHMNYYLNWVQKVQAADWPQVEANLEQIRTGFQEANRTNDQTAVRQYLQSMGTFFARRGLWEDWREWTEIALAAVQTKDTLYGVLYSNLGAIYHKLKQWEKALEAYRQGVQLLEKANDPAGLAILLNNMGAIYVRLNLLDEALEVYEQGQVLLEDAADLASQAALATTLNNIGAARARRQEWETALAYHHLSQRFYTTLQDRLGLANTLNYLGGVYDQQGQAAAALNHFAQGHALYVELGDLMGECTALYNMALLAQDAGDVDQAAEYMARVVAIDEQLHLPDVQADREFLGRLLQQQAENPAP